MPLYHLWFAAGLSVAAILLWRVLPEDRSRVRTAFGFLSLWAGAALVSAVAAHWNIPARVTNEVGRTLLVLAAIQTGCLFLFDFVLRRIRLPKIASEMAIVAAYAAALLHMLTRLGVDATGLFATSAVATAVIGLALQDMLNNLAGGVTLQLEDSINAGDYIRCSEGAGWVQHVRLRHTSVRTSDGDTVMIPNSFLTRSPVTIVSKAHRKFIPFAMPYMYDPHEVIHAVGTALRASPILNVAVDPAPQCLIQELTPGHIQYAAAVWLSNPGVTESPTSAVLHRIYYALQRAGIPVSEISTLLEKKPDAPPLEEAKPEDILRRIPIFRPLEESDLSEVAKSLRRHTFAPGELLLRQGDPGDSMYFVLAGRVGITYRSPDGAEQPLATFDSGDFFGEVSLLTGEVRGATATAMSRVICYCLDKAGLQRTMELHPHLAEDMSVIMAGRLVELNAARDRWDRESALRREAESQTQMLARIRRFFGISSGISSSSAAAQ
ncbi:MAG TPA: mechanosensitive ion channel family protein [Bryobacteraceae bacterium]|nr:mechanosensitive ion channel family protein [Bryobacteraceae bacterium]